MRTSLLLSAGLLLSAMSAAFADGLPTSQALLDLSDAAAGAVPNIYRETIEFEGTAGAGKRVIYRRGTDRREVTDAGPIHTEFGIHDGDRWHENANGHVVSDTADPGLASSDAVTTTVTRVAEPVDAYVIAVLNAEGHGTRDFYDPISHFLVRRETLTATGKMTTVYDTFRTFGARHIATHWTQHDETTGSDSESFVREYAAGNVAESDVAVPVMKRALVEYPAGVDRVVLPATFEPSGHIVVRLTINGRGLDMLLDSGSASITLDPGVAHQLGLDVLHKRQSTANAGRFATGDAVVPAMSVGSLVMHDTVVSIVPLAFEETGARAVGLLGFDFLCESGITIDYEHQTVTTERFGTYAAPHDPRTVALDVRLGSQVPMTSVAINGAVAERVMLDTGAVGPFLLFDFFQRRHPEALPRRSLDTQTVSFRGAGGSFAAKSAVLDSFVIGNVSFTRFQGFLVDSRSSYSFSADGVIGPTFLRFFDVHLDYPNGTVFLVPNATGLRLMKSVH